MKFAMRHDSLTLMDVFIHELRNSLGAGILAADLPMSPETWEIARNSLINSVKVIEQFAEMRKHEEDKIVLHKERVSLKKIILQAAQSASYRKQNRKLNLELRSDYELCIDPSKIQQVFLNLLVNSYKYTAEDGVVDVRLWEDLYRIYVVIQDNGIGISSDLKAKLFQYGVQGKNSTEGKGIGLSLCKLILDAHSATIDVVSEGEGQGSSFIIKFFKNPLSGETQEAK